MPRQIMAFETLQMQPWKQLSSGKTCKAVRCFIPINRFRQKLITTANGIIAFDAQRVGRMNLPTTRSHPSDPDLKIYQINFFHSLHCLVRISLNTLRKTLMP